MYLAIVVLPILGSIVSGLFGRKVGVSGAQLVTCLSVMITTFMATIGFLEVGLNNIPVSVLLFRWVDSESLNVLWGFNFDSLTVSMLIPVLIVSSLVHMYSIGYMSQDPHNQRFFSYLSLFTFMMIVLVTANNFLLMFVGWEGVGVCSYLLVSFWFTRIAANQSSMSAFLTNRVGDCFLTLGMFAMIWTFGNLDYSTVFSLAPYINGNIVTIIGICLLIGAMAKSSQIGLHVWLPLAMEGPTPVSALIHAATMVTAGVYLLMRTSPLIEYSSTVLILCLWIGSITTVFSSLIGLFQQDIKKVIAYSTMSQLGMMVIAVGLSSYNVALFHLVNHAFYKGLLFLGAGAVIHAVADNQDFRKYGGLIAFLPLSYSVMLIASLSLVAFPFMTGFYSKDFILESAYGQFHLSSIAVYFIATIGAMFTTLYSVKVLYLTFLTNANGPIINYKRAHEGDVFMSLPLIILAVFSIFLGYITRDMFIGMASGFFSDNSLFIHPLHEIMLDTEFAVPTLFKLLPFFLTVTLSGLSLTLSEFLPKSLIYFKLTRMGYNIFSFFNQRFLIELFYNKYITRFILRLGGQTTKVLDKGSIELLGPYGLEKGLLNLSKSLSSLDTGLITSYALYILIGLILYILIPYIYLKDISVLLSILFALLNITVILTLKNNIPRPHAFVSLPLQSDLFRRLVFYCIFSLKKLYINKCAIINKLWVHKYDTWAERHIILKCVWENILHNKYNILACLLMSIVFRGFVKWCFLLLGFSIILIILWYGLVYAVIMLNTKCWTSDYRFVLKDYVLWVITGTIIAGVIWICSNLLALLLFPLVCFAISINLLKVKPMGSAMYYFPSESGAPSSSSATNSGAPSSSSATNSGAPSSSNTQNTNVSDSINTEDYYAKLPLKIVDSKGNVMQAPDYDLDVDSAHKEFARSLAHTLQKRADFHKGKPGVKALSTNISYKWFDPETHEWLTVRLRDQDDRLCAEAEANNQPEPETFWKKWTKYKQTRLTNSAAFRDSLNDKS